MNQICLIVCCDEIVGEDSEDESERSFTFDETGKGDIVVKGTTADSHRLQA